MSKSPFKQVLISPVPVHGPYNSMGAPVGIHAVKRRIRPNKSRYPAYKGNLQDKADKAREQFSLQEQRQPWQEKGNYISHGSLI